MQTNLIDNLTPAAQNAAPSARKLPTQSFEKFLNPRDAATDRVTSSMADKTQELAQELVAITLFQPIFAQMRDDPFRSDMFHGGQVEDAFGPQLDAILSERIAQSTNFPIVEAIHRRMIRDTQATRDASRAAAETRNNAADRVQRIGVDIHG